MISPWSRLPILLLFLCPIRSFSEPIHLYGIEGWSSGAGRILNGKSGWAVEHRFVGDIPDVATFEAIREEGFTPLCVLEWAPHQSIPTREHERKVFTRLCAAWVSALGESCRHFAIGSGLNAFQARAIECVLYAEVFQEVRETLRAERPETQVLVGSVRPWVNGTDYPLGPNTGLQASWRNYQWGLARLIGGECEGYVVPAHGLKGIDRTSLDDDELGFGVFELSISIISQTGGASVKPIYLVELRHASRYLFHRGDGEYPLFFYPPGYLLEAYARVYAFSQEHPGRIRCAAWYAYETPAAFGFNLTSREAEMPVALEDFMWMTASTNYQITGPFISSASEAIGDRDGDGIPDHLEGGLAPEPGQTNGYLPDSDGDGLADGVEDANRNGIRDPEETCPRNRDSDGDGFEDGVETLLLGSNPLDAESPGGPFIDLDSDGLPTRIDPDDSRPDTDGDRFLDSYEAVMIGIEAVTNPSVVPRLGDVDGNGMIDNGDGQLLFNFFVGRPVSRDFDFRFADVNRDGVIDNADSQLVLGFFADLQKLLPVD